MFIEQYKSLVEFERVSPELVTRATRYPAALVGDMAGRRGSLNARVQAMGPGMKLAGPAFTVEVRPGDNLMMHVAIAIAKPGDIIVVDGKNDQGCALAGALMVSQGHAAKLGGFVVDAAVRDVDDWSKGAFPVFASGRNPCGPTKNVSGRLCIPISVAGAAVEPGDLVIGDADGVIVLPRRDVAKVLDQCEAKVSAEAQRLKEISEGKLISPWVDDAMRAAGILGADESLIASFEPR